MYRIQANMSGTRFIDVSDEHLQTIEKYRLFDGLVDSNGYVDENVLEKTENSTFGQCSSRKPEETRLCSTFAST